uniref:Uncharacterized protein n=1 Tax=Rhizophora mucronata TaxID=61149 RepID=A0A2P2IMG3_RHIMU
MALGLGLSKSLDRQSYGQIRNGNNNDDEKARHIGLEEKNYYYYYL